MKFHFLSLQWRFVIGICLALISISVGLYLGSHPAIVRKFVKKPAEEVLLKDVSVYRQGDEWFVRGNRVEWLDDTAQNREKLIALDACQSPNVKDSPCTSNGFYLHDTGDRMDLPVKSGVSIGTLIPANDSGQTGQLMSYKAVTEYENQPLPFLLKVGLKGGEVISIQERYVP